MKHLLLAILPFGALVWAQTPDKKPHVAPSPSLHPAVQSILDAAAAAPPEFAADAMLTVVEAGFIPDPKERLKVLEGVLNLAGYAEEKVALKWTGRGPLVKAANQAFNKRIDRISLSARAVRALLKLDPRTARERFDEIDLPFEMRFQCEQPFTFKFTEYYRVMQEVWKSLPGAARSSFLEMHFSRMRSGAQIEPLALVLQAVVKERPEDAPGLVYAFSSHLPNLDHDGRVFTAELVTALAALKDLASLLPSGPRESLVEKARTWVQGATRRGVCSDRARGSQALDGTLTRHEPPNPAVLFNTELAPLGRDNPVLNPDATGTPPGPAFELGEYSSEFMRFFRMRQLLEEDDPEGKASARWQSEVEKYTTLLVNWKDEGKPNQDPTAHYLEKAEALYYVIAMDNAARVKRTPQEWLEISKNPSRARFLGRDRAMLALVSLYESQEASAVNQRRHCLWFAPVRSLLSSPGNDEGAVELLAASRHPTLRLYGMLAKLQSSAGRKYF